MLLGACTALLGAGPGPLVFSDMDGEAVRVAPSEGESVVVHFWATWCRSCLEEFAVLDAEAQRCAKERVRVVAVNVGDESDEIRRFLEERPLSIPILRDAKGKVWRDVAGMGLPANLFWAGDTQRVEVGPLSLQDWRRELGALGCSPSS